MTPQPASSPRTDPQPLEMTDELARQTTRQLARNLESVALLIQALLIVNTAFADQLRPGGRSALLIFAALHLALAGLSYGRKGGLFSLGGAWVIVHIIGVLLTPMIMAYWLLPAQYGASPACVQLCGYPVPPVVLFSFYPWISVDRDYMRPALHLAVLSIIVIEPLLVIRGLHGYVAGVHLQSAAISGSLIVAGYLFGKVVGAMCRSAARSQLEALDAEYTRLFEHLHSNVETTLAVIQRQFALSGLQEPEAFRELLELVNVESVKLMLARPDVYVAKLLNLHARRIADAVAVSLPYSGGLTIKRSAAATLDYVLGNLLKNSVVHAARTVKVGFRLDANGLELTVSDDGPGFGAEVFDDVTTSLHRVHKRVREEGGALELMPTEVGATLRLRLPFSARANR